MGHFGTFVKSFMNFSCCIPVIVLGCIFSSSATTFDLKTRLFDSVFAARSFAALASPFNLTFCASAIRIALWLPRNSIPKPTTKIAKDNVSTGRSHLTFVGAVAFPLRRSIHLTTNSVPSPTTPTMTIMNPNSETNSQNLSQDESRAVMREFYCKRTNQCKWRFLGFLLFNLIPAFVCPATSSRSRQWLKSTTSWRAEEILLRNPWWHRLEDCWILFHFAFTPKQCASAPLAGFRLICYIFGMSTVAEIESAIEKLPAEEQQRLREWFGRRDKPHAPVLQKLRALAGAGRNLPADLAANHDRRFGS